MKGCMAVDFAEWQAQAEGGPETKLWSWYQTQGFTPVKEKQEKETPASGVLYGALRKFIPELQQ